MNTGKSKYMIFISSTFKDLLGLREYDELKGIDWSWQSMDGAMTKAPLGGEKNRPQPHGSSQRRRQT